MTILQPVQPTRKVRPLLTAPPSNPPIDVVEVERRLAQMESLLGR
jgi:hypothetical protein